MSYSYAPNANNNAGIKTHVTSRGSVRTSTVRRDSGINVNISTNKSGTTRAFLEGVMTDDGGAAIAKLDGRELRTLYRVICRHFEETGKSLDF